MRGGCRMRGCQTEMWRKNILAERAVMCQSLEVVVSSAMRVRPHTGGAGVGAGRRQSQVGCSEGGGCGLDLTAVWGLGAPGHW